jgi:hypothetical protein
VNEIAGVSLDTLICYTAGIVVGLLVVSFVVDAMRMRRRK